MRFLLISLLIVVGVVLNIIADVILKKGGYGDWKYLMGGFLIYGLIALPVAVAFKYTEFGQLFLIWEAIAVIIGVITASLYFGEVFTAYRLIALLLSLVALWFAYK